MKAQARQRGKQRIPPSPSETHTVPATPTAPNDTEHVESTPITLVQIQPPTTHQTTAKQTGTSGVQINRGTLNMKTPEFIPVNDDDAHPTDAGNANRSPVLTLDPGHPLETQNPVFDIDIPEWLDQSPVRGNGNEAPDKEHSPVDTRNKDRPAEPVSESTPSSNFMLLEREELEDAGEADIALLMKSGYVIGSGPKAYWTFECKVYVWPDYIDLVRQI
ncbi:hypothetical protein R1sor_026813 [Riccia sorocarpa]|uniref:Uncharacterized protein n=1 Tax=Riccia sorocarpa TaxID=122646 RepID=A0ABD3GFM1_9MARC